MDENTQNTCQNCGYYIQHYIWHREFRIVYTGHCTHPPRARRNCRPWMRACEKWISQSDEYRRDYLPPDGPFLQDGPPLP